MISMKSLIIIVLLLCISGCISDMSPFISTAQKQLSSVEIKEDVYYMSKLYPKAGYFSQEAIEALSTAAEDFCVDSGFEYAQFLPKDMLLKIGMTSPYDDRPTAMQGKFAKPGMHYLCGRAPETTSEGSVLIKCLDRICDYLGERHNLPNRHNGSVKVFEIDFKKISTKDDPYEHGVYFAKKGKVIESRIRPEDNSFLFGVEFKYNSRGLTTNLMPLKGLSGGNLVFPEGELGGNRQWLVLSDEDFTNEYFITINPSADKTTLVVKASLQ